MFRGLVLQPIEPDFIRITAIRGLIEFDLSGTDFNTHAERIVVYKLQKGKTSIAV